MSTNSNHDASRRSFIKKVTYVAPVVMTLNAVPSYATTGSCRDDRSEKIKNHSGGSNYEGGNNFRGGSNYSGGNNFRGGNHGRR